MRINHNGDTKRQEKWYSYYNTLRNIRSKLFIQSNQHHAPIPKSLKSKNYIAVVLKSPVEHVLS
jgi:hypothetical protein